MRGTPEGVREKLGQAGAHLKPVAGGYELRLSADGRRRAVDRLNEADLQAVQALGPLTRHADGRLSLKIAPAAVDLADLIREGYFDRCQLLALDQWRRDHEAGFAAEALTQNWARFGGGGRTTTAGDASLYRIYARRRVEEAERALSGAGGDMARAVRRVSIEGWRLAAAGFAENAAAQLSQAFDRLAVYYRIGA